MSQLFTGYVRTLYQHWEQEAQPHLGTDVMVHGVDYIVQQVYVQFLTEVQQLSGRVIRQHRHFCWHRASEDRGGEEGKFIQTPTTAAPGSGNNSSMLTYTSKRRDYSKRVKNGRSGCWFNIQVVLSTTFQIFNRCNHSWEAATDE